MITFQFGIFLQYSYEILMERSKTRLESRGKLKSVTINNVTCYSFPFNVFPNEMKRNKKPIISQIFNNYNCWEAVYVGVLLATLVTASVGKLFVTLRTARKQFATVI